MHWKKRLGVIRDGRNERVDPGQRRLAGKKRKKRGRCLLRTGKKERKAKKDGETEGHGRHPRPNAAGFKGKPKSTVNCEKKPKAARGGPDASGNPKTKVKKILPAGSQGGALVRRKRDKKQLAEKKKSTRWPSAPGTEKNFVAMGKKCKVLVEKRGGILILY